MAFASSPSPPPAPGGASARAATPPAEGERRAQRGYGRQYESSAAAIYAELNQGDLQWIGLADPQAGIADDLVLGLSGRVVGHQFKSSRFPESFRVSTILTGADGLLLGLIQAWQSLRQAHPGQEVEIRLVTNNLPSTTDASVNGGGHSAGFAEAFALHGQRSLADWRATEWHVLVDALARASGLDEGSFDAFFRSLRLMCGPAADFAQVHRLSAEGVRLAGEIAKSLPQWVADPRNKTRWSRAELLQALGWRDSALTRHGHQFPVDGFVERNLQTEAALRQAIDASPAGYIALVGPPGAGKSTLLQTALETQTGLRVLRYLAFVPGVGQGIGRGEADDFLEDVAIQLKRSGLIGLRFRDDSLHERREQFSALLREAGQRFTDKGVRTVIVVDGLDHVPREERPQRSLLAELPAPQAIPLGVLFVLGTQRLELDGIPPAVIDQAGASDRKVPVALLSREAVHRIADKLGLAADIDRSEVYRLAKGHPLVTRYVVQQLHTADPQRRQEILAGSLNFAGDVQSVYESAWRGIRGDEDAVDVLGYLARAEGPIPLPLLATVVPEPAIERALKSTGHLLAQASQGWSVFHNSFRLFVLEQRRERLGAVDLDYSPRVYRELAALARTAPVSTPQRWLELRYLARAQDQAAVLALALPERFRRQLAEGRAASEIQADLRLALQAARTTHDEVLVMRLLLARDEIARRATAFEYAHGVVDAYLAIGDLEGAQAHVLEHGTEGYKVVDALLAAGDHARAATLFASIEPLHQLLSGRLEDHELRGGHAGLSEWAQRVCHFRDVDQIDQAIQRITAADFGPMPDDPQEVAAELSNDLRQQVALAMVAQTPDCDAAQVLASLRLDEKLLPELLVHAALHANGRGRSSLGIQLLQQAIQHPHFGDVNNAQRRQSALFAFETGRIELAEDIYGGLKVPAVALLDDERSDGAASHIARAVLEHAQLSAMLGKPNLPAAPSSRALMRPLQLHAAAAGELLGAAMARGPDSVQGRVARAANSALGYLERATAVGGSDFFAVQQITLAAPVLGQALIRAAAICGEAEFQATLAQFDAAFDAPGSVNGGRTYLRKEVAVAVYRATGDTQRASERLEPLIAGLRERTPESQIDALATLAATFAQVGNVARARQVMAQLHSQSLGYALAPKKDPQYALWLELLARANAQDPAGRTQRTAFLIRQLRGMQETEGYSAAYRIAAGLVTEGTLSDPGTGFAAARAIFESGSIGWANLVDALLEGVVRRRRDLARLCSTTWCALALPYYKEPHFRQSDLGKFIDVVLAAAAPAEFALIVDEIRAAVETVARAHERVALLERLQQSVRKHRHSDGEVDAALERWRPEAPAPRFSYTPQKYDEAASLAEFEAALVQQGSEGPGYEAPYAFVRLAPQAGYPAAKAVFERWPALHASSRARFMIIDLAREAGDVHYARQLMADVAAQPDDEATWCQWYGGGAFRLHRARVLLDGPSQHRTAFEHFVGALAGGRESITGVLMEASDILPVICENPDWAGTWNWLQEQLAVTREHVIGEAFEHVADPQFSDEVMIAGLYRWAVRLPLSDLKMNARRGLVSALVTPNGAEVFTEVVGQLLDGKDDDPAEGLQLLLADARGAAPEALEGRVSALVDHADFAVAECAAVLLHRWGRPVTRQRGTLPPFYNFILDDEDPDPVPATLVDTESGAKLVESPEGWTVPFSALVERLARAQVSPGHVRTRAKMFIDRWGGLAAHGAKETADLKRELRNLDMRLTFWRPHVLAGARSLRYVAGELLSAGLIQPHETPFLLHMMGYPAPRLSLMRPVPRPSTIRRPAAEGKDYRDDDEEWVSKVTEDVAPLQIGTGKVLAELTTFEIRSVSRVRRMQMRIRMPFLEPSMSDSSEDHLERIERTIWTKGLFNLYEGASATVVSRLIVSQVPEDPRNRLTICPVWLLRLGWRPDPQSHLRYLDSRGQVVATIVWWRDGGPVDIEENVIWGEGVVVIATPEGLAQLEAVAGTAPVYVHVERWSTPLRQDGSLLSRIAVARD